MDPLTLMILTLVGNALVTGIILFLFQKRVESSLARKSFEHQIKYSKVYPKTLEVLEKYHEKLLYCLQISGQFTVDVVELSYGKRTFQAGEAKEKEEKITDAFFDFGSYLQSNKLYLPDQIVDEIEAINGKATIFALASTFLLLDISNQSEELFIKQLEHISSLTGVPMEEEESEAAKADLFIGNMHMEFINLLKRVEKVYKSITELTDEKSNKKKEDKFIVNISKR